MKNSNGKLIQQSPAHEHSVFLRKGKDLSDLSDSAYLFMDLSGKVLEASTKMQLMLGHASVDIVNHSFFKHWVVPNMGKALIKRVLCDKVIRKFVADISHKQGSVIVASINAQFVMDEEHRTTGIECLISDVTDLQKQEQKFDETLRNVTGGIAHLINNQMASVVGTANLVKMQLGDRPELAKKLDRISRSGLQAGNVAHNLVAYAQTGEQEAMQHIDLNGIISSVARDCKNATYAEQPLNLSFKIDPDIHPMMGSERQLTKILTYLLANAIDATDEQGEILITSKNVSFLKQSTGVETQHVLLSIQDNGHGMDKETQKRIFEPFFSTRFQGRGMSMAHTLKVVERYNGHIHVKSDIDKGSLITLHFPAALELPITQSNLEKA
ncbi:MAG: PAS domain-containing sensor histidine kinase [Ghiorsea sp.]